MGQKLIIKWKYTPGMLVPFTESFFCKTQEAAQKIFDRRNTQNIKSAIFFKDKNQTYIIK